MLCCAEPAFCQALACEKVLGGLACGAGGFKHSFSDLRNRVRDGVSPPGKVISWKVEGGRV